MSLQHWINNPVNNISVFTGSPGVVTSTLTALTGNTNDYAPTITANALNIMRISSTGDINITGLAGGVDGQLVQFTNIGTHTITLTNQDSGSTAANRFLFSGADDQGLTPDSSIVLYYDGSSSRWRKQGD